MSKINLIQEVKHFAALVIIELNGKIIFFNSNSN